MRAVVIEEPNRAAMRELDAPRMRPDDVVVRSVLAGVCRTDLEIYRGMLPSHRVSYPCIPGHEWMGEIADVGDRIDDLKIGDRVVCEGMVYCGTCASCTRGATNLCLNYDQLGYTRPGGYGELVAVPGRVVHRLPEGFSSEAGVLVEPAACVVRALERSQPQRGWRIAVIGIGTLGAIALRVAQAFEPAAVTAVGLRDSELELAARLGATDAWHAEDPELREIDAPDLVVEAAGDPAAVHTALDLVARGGRVVVLGLAGKGRNISYEQDALVRKDLTVIGSVSYTSSTWSQTMELVATKRLHLDDLVTQRFPIEDFAAAFDLLDDASRHNVKILLEHSPSR